MKISLIQPRYFGGVDTTHEPLNLGYIASFLIKKGYKNISIHSALFESDKNIIAHSAFDDVIGITATSPLISHAYILIDKIKNKNPNAIIVLGGIHPSALPEVTLRNKNIDFIIRGEGEVTFYELVRAIDKKEDIKNIAGISYRGNGKVIHNQERELIRDLDSIPYPERNLFKQINFIEKYYRIWKIKSAAVLSSRGCPFECKFCASNCVWQKKWRARSPANIVTEIKSLIEKYNIQEIQFSDASFAIDKQRVIVLGDLLRKEKIDIYWKCFINVSTVDKEVLKSMKASGCSWVGIGIESGSPEILQDIKNGVNLKKVNQVFEILRKIKLCGHAFFLVGFPNDNFNTIKEIEYLIDEIKPKYASCGILIPFPGSYFY